MKHSCRKCFCSRDSLENAETYDDIHCQSHIARTDDSLNRDNIERQMLGVKHVNGVGAEALFKDFPFFNTSKVSIYHNDTVFILVKEFYNSSSSLNLQLRISYIAIYFNELLRVFDRKVPTKVLLLAANVKL